MIRTEVVVKANALHALNALIAAYPELVQDAAETAWKRVEPSFRHDLEYTPPPPRYPIQWQSERQRRAFFATNGFGGGIPYRRTGRVSKAWKFRIVTDEGGIAFTVENTAPYAPYVLGHLRPGGRDPQQRMHKATGWKNMSPTIAFFADAAREETVRDLDRLLRGR